MKHGYLSLLNQARKPEWAEPVAWQSMDSAPNGAITEDVGCRGESVWFLGRVSERYRAGRPEYIVIKRRGWPNEDSWVCAGETYYMPDFFDAWSPLYAHPAHEAGEVERLRRALEKIASGYAGCDDFQDAQEVARAVLEDK